MEAYESTMTKHDDQLVLKLWGVRETARYLGIPTNTLYQWRAKGYGPPGRRIGRYIKYVPQEVYNWVQDQPEGSL
jgi:predicted DNA-binding transcriptional regulator AlpA